MEDFEVVYRGYIEDCGRALGRFFVQKSNLLDSIKAFVKNHETLIAGIRTALQEYNQDDQTIIECVLALVKKNRELESEITRLDASK